MCGSQDDCADGLSPVQKHRGMVVVLLDNKADINSPGENRRTALILAASLSADTIVKLLLERGADIKLMSHAGESYCWCTHLLLTGTLQNCGCV